MTRRHLATVDVELVDGQFALRVETTRGTQDLLRTDTLCTAFVLAAEVVLRECHAEENESVAEDARRYVP